MATTATTATTIAINLSHMNDFSNFSSCHHHHQRNKDGMNLKNDDLQNAYHYQKYEIPQKMCYWARTILAPGISPNCVPRSVPHGTQEIITMTQNDIITPPEL